MVSKAAQSCNPRGRGGGDPDPKAYPAFQNSQMKNQVVAEYALRDLAKPVGISSDITTLVESLPREFRGSQPSPKELETELKKRV